MKTQLLRNTPPQDDPQELIRHFSATYFSLRIGLTALAFTFPVLLFAYGKWMHGLDLQPSMSAYFWAAATALQCASFPMRTIFVGFLFAIGIGLYLYKGATPLENVLLNLAGVCAVMVAIFPESIEAKEAANERIGMLFSVCSAVKDWAGTEHLGIHFFAAVALFMLLAIVSWFCAEKTLDFAPEGVDVDWFRRTYKVVAILMLIFPLVGIAVAWALGLYRSNWVFFVEAAGIWTFGSYWAVKSRELWLSKPEKEPVKAIENARRRRQRRTQKALPPGSADAVVTGR